MREITNFFKDSQTKDGKIRRRNALIISILIFFISLLIRVPFMILIRTYNVDEMAALQTVLFLQNSGIIVHPISNNYLGIFTELLNLLIFQIFSLSLFGLRLAHVLVFAMAVLLSFNVVHKIFGFAHALAVASLLAIPVSSFFFISISALPENCLAFLFIVILISMTINIKYNATYHTKELFIFGIISGLAIYTHKIVVIQFAVCVVYIMANYFYISAKFNRENRIAELRSWFALYIIAFLPLSLPIYRFLTRRNVYHIAYLVEWVAFGVSAALLVLCVLYAWRRRIFDIGFFRALASIMIPAIGIPYLASQYFNGHGMILYNNLGVVVHSAGTYALKHAHEWPSQLNLYVSYVLPRAIIGNVAELRGGYMTHEPFHIYGCLLSIAFIGLYGIGVISNLRREEGPPWKGVGLLFWLPPMLLTVVLIPSYRLANEFSYRYYFPFLCNIFLLLVLAVAGLAGQRYRRALLVFVGLSVAYAMFDNVRSFDFSNPYSVEREIARQVEADGADIFVSTARQATLVSWVSLGRVRVASADGKLPAALSLQGYNQPAPDTVLARSDVGAQRLGEIFGNRCFEAERMVSIGRNKYRLWKFIGGQESCN